ncbi:MAG TPA: kelch repeat-containing protein, partial [Gemmatimonadales bacterium]|nr:kelch repeat-containing protein [Gemmatimonadales bacterium]
MGSKLSAFVLAVIVVSAVAPSEASAQAQPTGSWSNEATGDYFYMGRGVTDGTYLYIIGGYQASGSTQAEYYARFRRYDPANNSWTNLPQIAAGTNTGDAIWGTQYHAAAYHSANGVNRIYIFGGYNYSGNVGSTTYSAGYTNAIRVFTFNGATSGTWSTISTTLSSTRYYHAAVTYNDRIYVMGGVSSNANEIFNPLDNTMAQGTAMPGYLYYHGATVYPPTGKIYVMAGYGVAGYTGINYEYTPEDSDASTNDSGGTWTTRASISNGTATQNVYYGPGVVTLNNRIYVIAGINQSNNAQNNVFEYNPATNLWAQRASTASGHYGWPGAGVINGRAYIYGGYPTYVNGEEFTPPDFGDAPNEPSSVTQSGSRTETAQQALADSTQFEGWTNAQITFTAPVTDPNATQQVRFRVQVKPQAAAWTTASAITTLDTGLTAQGTLSLTYNIPAGGGYDWRWRIEDSYNNSFPDALATTAAGWIEAFSNTTS